MIKFIRIAECFYNVDNIQLMRPWVKYSFNDDAPKFSLNVFFKMNKGFDLEEEIISFDDIKAELSTQQIETLQELWMNIFQLSLQEACVDGVAVFSPYDCSIRKIKMLLEAYTEQNIAESGA